MDVQTSWKEPFLRALLESDKEKLTELVQATESTLASRAQRALKLPRSSRRTQRNGRRKRGFAHHQNRQTRLATGLRPRWFALIGRMNESRRTGLRRISDDYVSLL